MYSMMNISLESVFDQGESDNKNHNWLLLINRVFDGCSMSVQMHHSRTPFLFQLNIYWIRNSPNFYSSISSLSLFHCRSIDWTFVILEQNTLTIRDSEHTHIPATIQAKRTNKKTKRTKNIKDDSLIHGFRAIVAPKLYPQPKTWTSIGHSREESARIIIRES